eukprot:6726048-Pyramimonas_sp.AAC.1
MHARARTCFNCCCNCQSVAVLAPSWQGLGGLPNRARSPKFDGKRNVSYAQNSRSWVLGCFLKMAALVAKHAT